jgi:hypothetical protein
MTYETSAYELRKWYGPCTEPDCNHGAIWYQEETGRAYCAEHASGHVDISVLERIPPVSYAERACHMRHSLLRQSVSESDTLVVLEDIPGRYGQDRLKVAHISATGWVDLFWSETRDNPADDVRRHVSVDSREARELMAAYAAWEHAENVRECQRMMTRQAEKFASARQWNGHPITCPCSDCR